LTFYREKLSPTYLKEFFIPMKINGHVQSAGPQTIEREKGTTIALSENVSQKRTSID
jgi:hypothetical protein